MTARQNEGKVTLKILYDALEKQNDRMGDMERRLTNKIDLLISDGSPVVNARLRHVEQDINNLKIWDKGIGILAILGSAIASYLGIRIK